MDRNRRLQVQMAILTLNLLHLYAISLAAVYYLCSFRRHRWWVRPIWQRRQQEGIFHTVIPRLLLSGDNEYFFKYFRMSHDIFHGLCARLTPRLEKFPTNRKAISPAERVSIALRFLASGDSVGGVAMAFRVGITTAARCINEVCDAIYDELQPEVLPAPTKDMWREAEVGFRTHWQFPCCVGAIDGKHIIIQCPANSGTTYFNYKSDYSLVLLPVVDASYRFLYVDIGAYGSQSDGGIFRVSAIGRSMFDCTLDLPENRVLQNSAIHCCMVGDSAFPLHVNLMKPFPSRGLNHSRRIFNYCLSRARRCVENAFGILTTRW